MSEHSNDPVGEQTPTLAAAWDRVEDAGHARDLPDEALRELHLWCIEHDIALPPAFWVAEECGRREMC